MIDYSRKKKHQKFSHKVYDLGSGVKHWPSKCEELMLSSQDPYKQGARVPVCGLSTTVEI